MTQDSSGPLAGLKVVEMGALLAGPFCGQLLGDMGADIIKIEPPGKGDPLREWGPARKNGEPFWFSVVGRNKRSITLDLRQAKGQELAKALIAKTDILIENFRPGTMEKWGMGYEALSAINPGLIMVRVSGYGQTGPKAHLAGYASVGEAMGGLRYVMGEKDRPPARAGISLGDSLAATYACIGALAALNARGQTGRGQMVDTSIYEASLAMMESLVPDYALGGHIRERTGSFLPKIAPSNIYHAADGMMIIAANQDSVFARLAAAMGREDLITDPLYQNHVARGENQAALDGLISEWAASLCCADLEALLEEHGVPCGLLYRAKEMLEDAHFKARESITTLPHPRLGDMHMANVTPKFSGTPAKLRHIAPDLGADSADILLELGLEPQEIATLKNNGVI